MILLVFCLAGSFVKAQQELPITYKPAPPPDDGPGGGGPECSCYPERVTHFGVRWILGTCRSLCTRGIGFRCGREGFLICESGKMIVCIKGGDCPGGPFPGRSMTGFYSFYDNNTVKITFQNAIPQEERGNDAFEVEEKVTIEIPKIVLIGDERYSSFVVDAGVYKIDYDDGEFGSVILPIKLINN